MALALREFPYANRRVVQRLLGGRRLQQFHQADICVAFERDLPEAPMIAFIHTLRAADRQSLEAITAELAALTTCSIHDHPHWRLFHTITTRWPTWLAAVLHSLPSRLPRLWVRYRGGAVLVSSPAKYGVDMVAASWPAPLGVSFGVVKERPVVEAGQVVARPTFVLTLNFDRRVMAGAQAARFFRRLVDILEHAAQELDTVAEDEAVCAAPPA